MYGLEKLSTENWGLYADKINQYKNDTAILDESGNQTISNENNVIELEKFFDIFENKFENDKIKKIVNETRLKNPSVSEEEVALLLPNYSPMAEDFEARNLETQNNYKIAKDLTRINDQGVNYAIRHATSINHPKYFYFNADCTNFASQILEASGVRQVGGSNEYSGWWHTGFGTSYGHKHSISWINANTFAKYMGVGYTTKNHYYFSQNIRKYDFISFDRGW
ncbi:MAG: amidase domain-containing protein [Bacilli bacterium]